MFQTEPILYLQSLASDGLTVFMIAVTEMGFPPFFITVIMFTLFAVSFRKGFLLFQLLLWTGLITNILKQIFALPRPIYVDSNIQEFRTGDKIYVSEFTSMGAKGFFQPLDQQVVEVFRQQSDPAYGFPSGHVSSTTALWGGLSLLFENRIFRWITPFIIVLMALSRMYLGRHFLVSVIGGAILGGIMLLVTYQLLNRYSLQDHLFERAGFVLTARLPNLLFYSFLFIIPLLLFLTSWVDGEDAGYLLGVNAAFLIVMSQGLPDDSGTWLQRASRFLLGVVAFIVTSLVVGFGVELSGINDKLAWVDFIKAVVPSFIAVWGTVTLCVKLGLYKRGDAVDK